MREFRDDAGTEWVVFFTGRSVARDRHLPEEYREGWLAFESALGEKRRLAPAPSDWETLTEQELSSLCAQATPQLLRRRAAQRPESVVPDEAVATPQSARLLQPQLREMETRLLSALAYDAAETRQDAEEGHG